MAMDNPPFEDVFSIENGDFPSSHVSFGESVEISLVPSEQTCGASHQKSCKNPLHMFDPEHYQCGGTLLPYVSSKES